MLHFSIYGFKIVMIVKYKSKRGPVLDSSIGSGLISDTDPALKGPSQT